MAYAIVRTDNMAGTDVRGQLVSVKYMGSNGKTPTAIENGNVLKLGGLIDGEREIYVGGAVAVNDKLEDIVLIATPEVSYEAGKHSLANFINKAGRPCRGYHLHKGDTFSVTAEALDGTVAVGNTVELAVGTKLKAAASVTSGSTKVGKIIDKQTTGGVVMYGIKVC